MKKEFSGYCDWCGVEKETLVEHKDFEEGMAGRDYDVCRECRINEKKNIELGLTEEGGLNG
jgi:hypothetical protein